jgi:hypothetical protein
MLNEAGDTTIIWDEDRDEEMEEIIRRKMEEGVTFFIIEPRFFGLIPPKKTKLADPAKAREHRALSIPDADFAAFVSDGKGEAVPTPEAKVKGTRVSRNPKEVAKSESVGVKPMKGG